MHSQIVYMRKSLQILLFILITFPVLRAQQSIEYITHNSVQRLFIQYLPNNYNSSTESLPLVFVLHGLDGSAQQITSSGFNSIADTARFIPIYPQGKLNGFGQASWNNGTMVASNADDVGFIDTLIQHFEQQYNINSQKIYVCGFSEGGIMTHRLGLELNHKIAAIASMAGTISTSDKLDFATQSSPMPLMHWHGTVDQTIPFYSPQVNTIELVYPSIGFWKVQNYCSVQDSTIIAIPDIVQDNITVDRIVYEGCMNAPLELWKFNNGYHAWYQKGENDVDGASEFWNFFNQFENEVGSSNLTETEINLNIYPNPSHGVIKIQSSFPIEEISIYSLDGKLVFNENIMNLFTTEIKHNEPGVYILKIHTENRDFHKRILID